jgi:hypothetical protein
MVLENYLNITHNTTLKNVCIKKFLAMYLFTIGCAVSSFPIYCDLQFLLCVRSDHSRLSTYSL